MRSDNPPARRIKHSPVYKLSLIHISEPTRLDVISYAVFGLKRGFILWLNQNVQAAELLAE
ncbi:hypothetical protein ACX3VG_10815, partial [Escherichia coli]